MKTKALLLYLVSSVFSSSAIAVPFGTYDARSAGMGGTGVAVSQMNNAAFYNPAMLASPSGNSSFGITLPTIGAQLYAKESTLEGIDDFNTAVDDGDSTAANEAFNDISGDQVSANINGAMSIGFNAHHFNMALTYNHYASVNASVNGTDYSDATFDAVGYKTEESGVSFAFPVRQIYAGITLKSQSVETYDYSQDLSETSSDESDLFDENGEKAHGTHFNLDLGAAYKFDNGFTVGMVVRNALEESYTTANNQRIELKPQYRIGTGYRTHWFIWGVDYDLVKNDPVGNEDPTRMLSTGIELDAFGWGQFRLGLQDNLASGVDDTSYTAGIGLTPFGVGVDIAVQNNNDMLGAYLQLGATF